MHSGPPIRWRRPPHYQHYSRAGQCGTRPESQSPVCSGGTTDFFFSPSTVPLAVPGFRSAPEDREVRVEDGRSTHLPAGKRADIKSMNNESVGLGCAAAWAQGQAPLEISGSRSRTGKGCPCRHGPAARVTQRCDAAKVAGSRSGVFRGSD